MEFSESDESFSTVSFNSPVYSPSIESHESSVDSFPKLVSDVDVEEGNRKRTPQILDKLYYRELRGNFTPHPHSSNLRLFCQIPSRCQIRLRNVLPESALDSNHVFLGLSRCGQFLLSYTYTTELDVMSLNEVYKYRLHWWAYVPHQKVRKVSEVMLFGNQGVHSTLYIAVCQWPMDHSRVLIYGNCQESYGQLPGTWNTAPPERSFITITTVPSLNKCQDCLRVAASYEEEDLAASWDSCVRFSCLKHGLTVHTSFDVVSPFPKFEPSICMKREGTVVFNTGNFLHVLKAELEHLGSGTMSVTKSCTTGSILTSETSETIDQNPPSVASSVSDNSVSIKQDVSYSVRSNDESDSEVIEGQTFSQISKIYDTRLHRKQVCIQQPSVQNISSSYDLSNSSVSKQEETRIGANICAHKNISTISENEKCVFRNRMSHIIVEDDTEEEVDGIGASDDIIPDSQVSIISNGRKNCSDQDLLIPKLGTALTKFGSDNNSYRIGSDSKIFKDFHIKSSEMSASECRVLSLSRSVLKVNGKFGEIDSKKMLDISATYCAAKDNYDNVLKSDCKSGPCTRDLEALSIRERGKDFRDGVFHGRITRSQSSRVSSIVQMGDLLTVDENNKMDLEKNKKNEILQISPLMEKVKYVRSDILKDPGDCSGISNKESRIMDSTQELNITCSNMNPTTSEEIVSVVTLMSPNPGTLLMVNTVEEYGNNDTHSTCERRKDVTTPTSSRTRRFRGGATVKLSSPLPAVSTAAVHGSGTNNVHSKIAEAEKAYEFTDDGLEPGCEKLSSFRRRRLADKKYEFCEEGEDAENIVPFRLTRRREMSPRLKSPPLFLPSSPLLVNHRRRHHDALSEPTELMISRPRSPQILASDIHPITQMSNHIEADKVVLRPLNRNTAAVLLSPRDRDNNGDWVKTSPPGTATPTANNNNNKRLSVPEPVTLIEHNSCDKLENSSAPPGNFAPNATRLSKKELSSPSPNNGNSYGTRCTVQLKRRYIEVDDELVSVITDIEDDDFNGSTGYHCALPLEVHGAGYVQLQMISNTKAGKLMAPCVLVHQRSFDVEQFCHEIAERLCIEAGKKYWFCNDYDVEIIDVCPFSGDVLAVALMRIQATIKTKGLAKSQRHPVSSLERQQYQGSCKFVWNVDTGHYVVCTRSLYKVEPNDDMDPWNPARDIAMKLRENINHIPMRETVKTISNELVLRGISLVKISDIENLTELTL